MHFYCFLVDMAHQCFRLPFACLHTKEGRIYRVLELLVFRYRLDTQECCFLSCLGDISEISRIVHD